VTGQEEKCPEGAGKDKSAQLSRCEGSSLGSSLLGPMLLLREAHSKMGETHQRVFRTRAAAAEAQGRQEGRGQQKTGLRNERRGQRGQGGDLEKDV
jgi:hypothetical protein